MTPANLWFWVLVACWLCCLGASVPVGFALPPHRLDLVSLQLTLPSSSSPIRPGPQLLDALDWLISLLHNRPDLMPEAFPWRLWQQPGGEAQQKKGEEAEQQLLQQQGDEGRQEKAPQQQGLSGAPLVKEEEGEAAAPAQGEGRCGEGVCDSCCAPSGLPALGGSASGPLTPLSCIPPAAPPPWACAPCLPLDIEAAHEGACAAGRQTYKDPVTGYSVYTAPGLQERGRCCGNRCGAEGTLLHKHPPA